MRAVAFTLSDSETQRHVGHAVVCCEAKYVSVRWSHANRIDRLHLEPPLWQTVEAELMNGVPSGPLSGDGALSRVLVPTDRRVGTTLQYLAEVDWVPLA